MIFAVWNELGSKKCGSPSGISLREGINKLVVESPEELCNRFVTTNHYSPYIIWKTRNVIFMNNEKVVPMDIYSRWLLKMCNDLYIRMNSSHI